MTLLLRFILLLRRLVIRVIHHSIEAISYLLNYIKPTPSNQLRVVIFAQGRTGSTLLESLLKSTGYFRSYEELFNIEKGEILFPLTFLYGLLKWQPKNNFIFHVKIYQLTKKRKHPVDPALFIETLYKDGWKIIYLRRRNKVKHALSIYFARNRSSRYLFNKWHKFDDRPEKLNISIECDKFKRSTEKLINYDAQEKKVLANIEYHEVVYEDDLEKPESHQKTVDRILNYLSLESREAFTKYRKVNNQSPEELVSNYEEFLECLSEQGWEKFLK